MLFSIQVGTLRGQAGILAYADWQISGSTIFTLRSYFIHTWHLELGLTNIDMNDPARAARAHENPVWRERIHGKFHRPRRLQPDSLREVSVNFAFSYSILHSGHTTSS